MFLLINNKDTGRTKLSIIYKFAIIIYTVYYYIYAYIQESVMKYTFYSPINEKFEFDDMEAFCKTHGLDARKLHSVHRRKVKSHKKWTKKIKIVKPGLHHFYSPDRERVNVRYMSDFCKMMGLNCIEMYKVSRGRIEEHQGWTKRK